MSTVRSNSSLVFFVAFLLLVTPSQSLSLYSYFRFRNAFSLAHSIFSGVANLRAARGDFAGADRARAIADTLERVTDLYGAVSYINELLRGLNELTLMESAAERTAWLSRNAFSICSGFANLLAVSGEVAGADRARAIADTLKRVTNLYGDVSDINELLRSLNELTRMESAAEITAWLSRNCQNLLTVPKSLSRKHLKAFGPSGVVTEVVETLQIEVVEGGLIRDCLELGGNDLKALIQVVKDLLLQFFPVPDKDPDP